MGARSAGILERGDTSRLIGRDAGGKARIDIGYARHSGSALGRVEIGVEHATGRAELELQPDTFAHLKRRIAEMADELGRGQPDNVASRLSRRSRDRLGLLDDGLHRTRGAGSEEQGEGGDKAAHTLS